MPYLVVIKYKCCQVGEACDGEDVCPEDATYAALNEPLHNHAHSDKRTYQRQGRQYDSHSSVRRQVKPVYYIKVGNREQQEYHIRHDVAIGV